MGAVQLQCPTSVATQQIDFGLSHAVFNARVYFDSIADHGGLILIDRELRGWSQGLADTA